MLRLVIVLLKLVPLIIKAEGKLQNDIAYLETRVELVDFIALRRAANDLSKRYPSQYDLQADLAQLNLFEKDYQKHKITFQKISIQLNANSNEVDEELVKLMAAAGCRQISLGFESGSERMLKSLNKRFSLKDVRTISSMFASHKIERMGFLLLGGPGETKETVEESLAFADSLDLDILKLTAGIRIYPDTQLAETAENQGVISSQNNLLYPCFYLAKGLEGWLSQRLKKWRASHPYVIM